MRKIVLYTLTLAAVFVILALPAVYMYATQNLVTSLPSKPDVTLDQASAVEEWSKTENCTPEQCSKITPYWLYRWLGLAIISDNITPLDLEFVKGNISAMSGAIALDWMRSGNIKNKGMLRWHLTGISLGIYIQRNWSTTEIVSKYQTINA